MGSYRLTEEAEEDLYRIWLYGLEHWGLERADDYHAAFFDHFEKIAENPFIYPEVSDLRKGYRRSICGKESVYYRVKGNIVEIMSILRHQDTDEWLG